jgi:hypothetical protein
MVIVSQMAQESFDGGSVGPSPGIPEVAVYLSRITDLAFREAIHWKQLVFAVRGAGLRSRGDSDPGIDAGLRALIFPADGAARPVRVYFGNEFCELRTPGQREFEESCEAVLEAGFPMTFVTPPLTDQGMRRFRERLTELQRWSPESEVVVNDWGALWLMNEEFQSLTPVLGRLMSKLLRDPRVTPRCGDPGVSPEALGALQKCSLNISAYRSLLISYGIGRIELDNVYQGVDMDFGAMGLRPSIYLPHGYVTTGRICLPANAHLPRDRKFGAGNGPCPLPCLRVEIGLADRNAKADGGVHTYTQRGNTVFYRQSEQLVSQGLTWAAQQGARLVYQPEIPF